ncbi:Phosphatidylglycerophosphate synthase [Porphyromonadaceae bacterium KH3R12]|jgi:phosphatidylglycerophosphate synthase|uniref:CDP-alcohol phosphatidyltransferase family protein n=1 Tax=Proteiniphilum saccharofermentans TaxID=1642647 RepID=UPI00089C81BC|nr:CDP-alcohol phosphatidyltransferase family protein [Proteiniphilum saccharofermentans]SDZ96529.1 Phosphatidylglycerophosphate synthase [Porphyromonadaceae bacterium KH3R12]
MYAGKNKSINNILKIISQDRERTNILKKQEQTALTFLVQRIPAWMTSDILTAIGFSGSIIILSGFVLAAYFGEGYLLLGILGYIISWFGDSLDGRVAYYRKQPRKWYGFALDITVDWIGVILMGLGFMIYVSSTYKIIGVLFVVLYGWEILTAQLRYKITGKYSIDSGILGPTEVRIIISLILISEVLLNDSIIYLSSIACVILLITNILDTRKLLKAANMRDEEEKQLRENKREITLTEQRI